MALVAPARAVKPHELEPAVKLLESWGLRVKIPEGLYAVDHQFAGSDSHRASLLQALLNDDEVMAIICVRGGYGTARIVDLLNFDHYCRHPKWIVGYSDITVLHSHIARHCHIATLHAIMPINIPDDADCHPYPATESLRQQLFDPVVSYRFQNNDDKCRKGRATAPIIGGNLSVLYSLLGSPSDIDTEGHILLLEDCDEYLYHVDRMMTALRRAGKLAKLKGLIIGSFSDMHDNSIPFGREAESIVREAANDYDYPVACHVPIGHIGTQNHALLLGATTELQITNQEIIISQ